MLSGTRPRTSFRRLLVRLTTPLAALLLAACGGSAKPPRPLAERICAGSARAAGTALDQPVASRILARDPIDLRCELTGRGVRVQIVSQATAQAYMEFDTETSHQDQVYGSGVHEAGQIPSPVSVPGSVAVWIRAQNELVATSGTPTGHLGAYVTVTVTGRSARGASALALARAVARATFAAHPGASS